jgi:ABC-type sugar transport system substrate-binding protein
VRVQNGALQAAKDFNINLKILTPVQADNIEELAQLTELAITNHDSDVIILFPPNSVGLIPAAEKVVAVGIPLVNVNTPLATPTQISESIIRAPDREIGYMASKEFCKMLNGKGNIILLEGNPGAQNSMDRIAGSKAGIAEYPEMKLLTSQPANFNRAMAMDVTQNLLQAYPDTTAILAMNTEMGLGALAAVEAAGKSGKIAIAELGADPDARTALKEGKILLCCEIGAYDQGYEGVKAAADILDGKQVQKLIEIPPFMATKENIAQLEASGK